MLYGARTQFVSSSKIKILFVLSLKQNHKKVYKKLPLYRDWVPGHNFLAQFKSRFSWCYILNKIIKTQKKSRCPVVIECPDKFVLLGIPKKNDQKVFKKVSFFGKTHDKFDFHKLKRPP